MGAYSTLNSKAEYDRCRIPRLIVEDEQKLKEEEESEISTQ